jgi:GTP-binding protein Era
MKKVGFITIIGLPSVGKSSLINKIMGKKILIESSTNQSTRNSVQAIKTTENEQMIFVDTPGIHKPHNHFGRFLNKIAYRSIIGVDLIIFMINERKGIGNIEQKILERIKQEQIPCILVLNKIDQISDKSRVLEIMAEYREQVPFDEFIPISVTSDINIDILEEKIISYLPVGEMYYDADKVTNKSERFIVSETIREKINQFTFEEIPHSTLVFVEDMNESKHEVYIEAVIVVERTSQKGIIIGKHGSMIKKIGTESRIELEQYFGKKVILKNYVKIEKKWREKENKMQEYDYDINTEV